MIELDIFYCTDSLRATVYAITCDNTNICIDYSGEFTVQVALLSGYGMLIVIQYPGHPYMFVDLNDGI